MSDCIFCKIANGEIPSNTVFENDNFRVILDISPANEGHCLILPKTHAANIFELSEELTGEAFKLAKATAEAINNNMEIDGINLLQNNGEAAGQTVFHFHIHVIPRKKNDGVVIKSEVVKLDDARFKEIAEIIGNKIK